MQRREKSLFLLLLIGAFLPLSSSICTTPGLRGEYFNNIDHTGTPVLERFEVPDYNWGSASPDPVVSVDR